MGQSAYKITDHYSDYSSFTEALIGFNQLARQNGFTAGLQVSKDTVAGALSGLWMDKALFGHALAALFCQQAEQRDHFQELYERFWLEKGSRVESRTTYRNQKSIRKKGRSAAVMTGTGKNETDDGEKHEAKDTSGANSRATLKETDFSRLNPTQSEELDEIADKLVREMSLRIKRKKKSAKRGTVNLGKTIRANLQYGGNILQLVHGKRKKEKYSLIVFLDVSGSMDKYSYYLLKFLWSLRAHFKNIEVFTFSTALKRITEELNDVDIKYALANVSATADHWSSGTKIGECLREFNDRHADRYMNGRTVSIVMSDGLDTGAPEVLSEATQKIKRRSKSLVWLNPLKGMRGYEPIQQGMSAVLGDLNHFGAAHNFNSLLELENTLASA